MWTRGIHVVWTCYGTWLPGDRRGHWSPLFDCYGRIRDRGGKLQLPDQTTRGISTSLLREPPLRLEPLDVETVADKLSTLVSADAAAAERPIAYAAAIEPTHVHLLLGPVPEKLEACIGRMKGTTSSAILASGRHGSRKHVRTEKYWKVFLYDALGLQAVCDYIQDHHLRAGRPANPYSWCHPELV